MFYQNACIHTFIPHYTRLRYKLIAQPKSFVCVCTGELEIWEQVPRYMHQWLFHRTNQIGDMINTTFKIRIKDNRWLVSHWVESTVRYESPWISWIRWTSPCGTIWWHGCHGCSCMLGSSRRITWTCSITTRRFMPAVCGWWDSAPHLGTVLSGHKTGPNLYYNACQMGYCFFQS